MKRSALVLAVAGLACAQDAAELFSKAPPAVDEALRKRISLFYQNHVDGKFRQADEQVAEDTKDFFFTANKPKYLGFEIHSIKYSHDFTRAKATVLCEQRVLMPGVGSQVFKVPTPSNWKLENGNWYWYVDPQELLKTPWGISKPGPDGKPASDDKPVIPDASQMGFIFTQVKADKQKVSLKQDGEAEVKITNTAKGAVNLVLPANVLGLKVSLGPTQLKSGESAVLRLKRTPEAKAGALELRVDPTNQVLPIQIALE